MPRLFVICLAVFTVIMQMKENLNATIQLTATPYLQTFVSHDTYGTTNYPDGNFTRNWLITGQIHNYTITIEFLACALETGNNKGVCIYDNVFIYDGKNASETLFKETCCGLGDTVPFPVYSTNGYMYIIFQTDDKVGNTGFRISYILEGAPTTTAQFTTSTNLDPVDGKLPVYIAVGCVAAVMIIISVVCCITWKKVCNNKIKIKGCDNDTKKHNS